MISPKGYAEKDHSGDRLRVLAVGYDGMPSLRRRSMRGNADPEVRWIDEGDRGRDAGATDGSWRGRSGGR